MEPALPQRTNRPLPALGALMTGHLLSDGVGNYLPGVLPVVLVTMDLPVSVAGAMIAALSIGQILQPLVGYLADRLGGRILPPLGLVLTSVGGGFIPLAPGFAVLLMLLFVIGVGSSLYHPPALAMIRRMPVRHTGLYVSAFLVGGEFGRGMWPTVASLITVHLGLGWLWLLALPGIAWAPLLYRSIPALPAGAPDKQRIRWRNHAYPAALLITYRGLQGFTVLGLSAFIPVLWHLRGQPLVTGAAVLTTLITLGVVGNLTGGYLADKVGRRPILVAAGVISAALAVPLAHIDGWAVFPVTALLGMSLYGAASPAVLIGQDIFPENRSMGSGVALGFANGLAATAVLIVGLLVTESTVLNVFWLFAAMGAVCVAVALMFPARLMCAPVSPPL